MKVIIPVAGWGTRFLPATKAQPKEMLTVVDKPVIQWIVEQVVAAGFKDIIFVTGRHKRALEDHFDNHFELETTLSRSGKLEQLKTIKNIVRLARFAFVRQNEPLGNGDAVQKALHLVGDEPAAVVWGDEILISRPPVLQTLHDFFKKLNSPMLTIRKVPRSEVSKYGAVTLHKTKMPGIYKINGIIEKPTTDQIPSNFVSTGPFILTPAIFKCLENLYPLKTDKEIYLTEAIQLYLKQGGTLYGYEFKGERFDCGSKIGLLKAQVEFGLKHPETKKEFRKFLKSFIN